MLESKPTAGTLDTIIDVLVPLSNDILRARIDQDTTVVAARTGHPAVNGSIDIETYLKQDHTLTSSCYKGPGPHDFKLSRFGMKRRIRLRCQHYFLACRVVRQTNLILTMPEHYARIANLQFGNEILPFPLEVPAFDVFLY